MFPDIVTVAYKNQLSAMAGSVELMGDKCRTTLLIHGSIL
jgi:hypothetical protein